MGRVVSYPHYAIECHEYHDVVADYHTVGAAQPEIVVLCGSTRFKDVWYAEGKRLTYEGRIVLSVGDLDTSQAARDVNVPISDELKRQLDTLHLRKIDLATRVHVLNVGGYVGESTRREIEYAKAHRKTITYLERDIPE